MTKKAVYYGRVSTSEQAETGLSMSMMKDETIAWAKAHDYEIVEFFEDYGKTGTQYKGLKELQKLHRYIQNNNISAILCWRLDRISRNDTEFYTHTMSLVEKLGMTIASVKQFPDIKVIPRVLIGVYLGLATDEVNSTKIRTKATMLHRAKQGYLMGKAPIGYLNKQENGHGIVVIDSEKAKYIKKIFELYATGLYTMKMVSQEVYKMGFMDKNNKPYPVRKIEHILQNIVYTGKVKYGKNDDGTDLIVQGKHVPIIPTSLYNKVQTIKRNDGKPYSKHTDKTYVKLIKCVCGGYLTGYHSHGAHNSGDYVYYKCHNRSGIHKKIKGIRQDTLDNVFQDLFSEIHIPKKVVELLKGKIIKALDEIYLTENLVYESNSKRLTELRTLIKKATEEQILNQSILSESNFNKQIAEWQEEQEILTENIKQTTKINKSVYSNLNTLMKFLGNIPDTYKNADTIGKQRLLRMVLEKVTFDTENQKLHIKLKPIFQALRIINNNITEHSKKVTTLPKVSSRTILEYLTKNIEISLKNKVTTLKTLATKEKTDSCESVSKNGAGSGIRTHA